MNFSFDILVAHFVQPQGAGTLAHARDSHLSSDLPYQPNSLLQLIFLEADEEVRNSF
ncbi:hypothetical protein Adeg_0273 [Ammonifex degensii KC4]|uniref:Uncharacterized protein n=1 Tax=Ammonifex degensii (strain DSM 10501 / KC4) TaxID=429009 RepID=C9RB13_AMMDK|nr:hypothetical protein Adeg_0273 [Ammonifex degensii KC4]